MTNKYKLPKIDELFEAGVHFGHQVRRWHPKMEPFIYTVKRNIHIIDLEKTEEQLKSACDFLYETARKGLPVVFIGTKRQVKDIVELEAKRCGAKCVTERWLGGTITNFRIIKKNIDKLVSMTKKRDAGEYSVYTKKERLLIDRDIEKLNKMVGGLLGLSSTPGALFIVDVRREKTAIREAKRAGIPTVALVDTNADPTNVACPIPGNDDAIKSVALILKTVASAVEEGYKAYEVDKTAAEKEKAKEEEKAANAPADDSENENKILGVVDGELAVEEQEDEKKIPKEKEEKE